MSLKNVKRTGVLLIVIAYLLLAVNKFTKKKINRKHDSVYYIQYRKHHEFLFKLIYQTLYPQNDFVFPHKHDIGLLCLFYSYQMHSVITRESKLKLHVARIWKTCTPPGRQKERVSLYLRGRGFSGGYAKRT